MYTHYLPIDGNQLLLIPNNNTSIHCKRSLTIRGMSTTLLKLQLFIQSPVGARMRPSTPLGAYINPSASARSPFYPRCSVIPTFSIIRPNNQPVGVDSILTCICDARPPFICLPYSDSSKLCASRASSLVIYGGAVSMDAMPASLIICSFSSARDWTSELSDWLPGWVPRARTYIVTEHKRH